MIHRCPYSVRGPWSPRLNVEQHHDWDATSLHSPPLQQLWLTAQHALFSPRKRALRMKPVFFSELSFVSFKVFLELFLIAQARQTMFRVWTLLSLSNTNLEMFSRYRLASSEVKLSFLLLQWGFKSIVISNCFVGANYCWGGAQLHSLLAQLIMGSQLALEF